MTGLPDSVAIEQELHRLINDNVRFSIIYIDLDYFKSYNDRYGFERGDRVILFTSRLLNSVLQKFGGEKTFLSHIIGDDFVIIIEKEQTDKVCDMFLRYFDRLIKSFYDEGDRGKDGILSFDREGMEKLFPFVSVSMAVIECEEDTTASLKSISEKAAQLKRYAKSISGSIVVKDRRNREA